MAPTYKTPGVYIEEVATFPPSVAEVETAIPAFIGYTEIAKMTVDDDLHNKPFKISSLVEFENYYGKANKESFDIDLVEDVSTGTFEITAARDTTGNFYRMYYGMQMFFNNGGGNCYIVSVGKYGTAPDKAALKGGIDKLAQEDEPTLIVVPDAIDLAEADYYETLNHSLDQCRLLQDRFAIIDIHNQNTVNFRSNISGDLDYLKYGAAYHPFLKTSLNFQSEESDVTIKTHTEKSGGAVTTDLTGKALDSNDIKKNNNVLYNLIKRAVDKVKVELPPSTAVAGVYARVDSSRGVWKAPANVSLMNVVEPSIKITNNDQASLNVDTTAGKSINAIRAFAGKGTLVWGARTLAGNDNEWRYVSVRRFFNMVEESVKKSTYWAVFEPNDANTWIRVKSMIENYLVQKWRDGALAGSTPEQAFFVNVGLGKTMTAVDILEGRMNVEIGMAAVRPAEFIILKFSHKMQEA